MSSSLRSRIERCPMPTETANRVGPFAAFDPQTDEQTDAPAYT